MEIEDIRQKLLRLHEDIHSLEKEQMSLSEELDAITKEIDDNIEGTAILTTSSAHLITLIILTLMLWTLQQVTRCLSIPCQLRSRINRLRRLCYPNARKSCLGFVRKQTRRGVGKKQR